MSLVTGGLGLPESGSMVAGGLGLPGVSGPLIKVWLGSSWIEKPMKVWNGSVWAGDPINYWDGAAWVPI